MRKLSLIFTIFFAMSSWANAKPKLAVMPMTDGTKTYSQNVLENFTDALRTQLAQTGKFLVIDKSRQAAALKELIREQKRESYKKCYAGACQIPLGQALAADSILRAKISRLGSSYLINAEFVDLAKEAVTKAAQVVIPVNPPSTRDDRMLKGLMKITRKLSGVSTSGDPTYVETTPSHPEMTPEQRQREREQMEAQRRKAAEAKRRREQGSSSSANSWSNSNSNSNANTITPPPKTRPPSSTLTDQEVKVILKKRRSYFYWGLTGLVAGGGLGVVGALFLTKKLGDAKNRADDTTSPDTIEDAQGEADTAMATGIACVAGGAVALGLGVYLLVAMPSDPTEVRVGSAKFDLLPQTGPTRGGWAVTWGGSF